MINTWGKFIRMADAKRRKAERENNKTEEENTSSSSPVVRSGPNYKWPKVDRFAKEMKRELEANVPEKGRTWDGCSTETMMQEVEYHVEKLRSALGDGDKEKIREHSADVANNAMMLADLVGVI